MAEGRRGARPPASLLVPGPTSQQTKLLCLRGSAMRPRSFLPQGLLNATLGDA